MSHYEKATQLGSTRTLFNVLLWSVPKDKCVSSEMEATQVWFKHFL